MTPKAVWSKTVDAPAGKPAAGNGQLVLPLPQFTFPVVLVTTGLDAPA